MIISQKTIEKLRALINEETEYRSGPKLVAFFNKYGFADLYEPGFPSRWIYTESKLKELNGKPELDKCIKDLFAPVNFISRFSELDKFISDFNQYLSFDGWQVVRQGQNITFQKAKGVDIGSEKSKEVQTNEAEFLKAEFNDISISSLPVDSCLILYLETRIEEIRQCLSVKAPLSAIFLIGSTLEGILLGVASKHPAIYNKANSAPQDTKTGKPRNFSEWTLNNFIDVSYEVGFLKEDVKKLTPSTLKSTSNSKKTAAMKAIKILKTALRILAAVPCTLVLWVVYFIVGMIEALISGVWQIVWGIVLFGVSLAAVIGTFVWILTL